MKILYALILLMFLVLTGCDSEKFLNFNYEAERLSKRARVSGVITNKFTGFGVAFARVQIDDQETMSDSAGGYQMEYILSADADQGREIPLRIEAENYHILEMRRVFYPEETRLDVELEYGAPIVEAAVMVNARICQALVFDYQGMDNIATVTVRLHYRDDSNNIVQTRDVIMSYRGEEAPGLGRFQADVPADYPRRDGDFIIVTALDKDGFSDTLDHSNNLRNPDTFLFPPGSSPAESSPHLPEHHRNMLGGRSANLIELPARVIRRDHFL